MNSFAASLLTQCRLTSALSYSLQGCSRSLPLTAVDHVKNFYYAPHSSTGEMVKKKVLFDKKGTYEKKLNLNRKELV